MSLSCDFNTRGHIDHPPDRAVTRRCSPRTVFADPLVRCHAGRGVAAAAAAATAPLVVVVVDDAVSIVLCPLH